MFFRNLSAFSHIHYLKIDFMTAMKTIHEVYETPEIMYLDARPEGVLCQSRPNTNEGVDFEDWN